MAIGTADGKYFNDEFEAAVHEITEGLKDVKPT